MNKQYRTCERCGANLDADEKCDCLKETSDTEEMERSNESNDIF